MTLKQQKLIANIPTSKSLKEAGIKAGYEVDKGRTIYRVGTKKHIAKFLDSTNPKPEEIIREFIDAVKACKTDKDYSNLLHALDSLARIKAMFVNKNIEDVTINQFNSNIVSEYDKYMGSQGVTAS